MTNHRHQSTLPLEARRVLWRKLWEQLLAPPPASTPAEHPPADVDQRHDVFEPSPKGGE